VRAYAASYGFAEGVEPADSWIDECERFLESGFRAIKLRLGALPLVEDAKIVELIAGRLPAGIALMFDGNGAFTPPSALRMATVLASVDARWFEEPLPQDAYVGYPSLTAAAPLPIAGGELIQSQAEAGSLLERRAFALVQPDPVICGGIEAAIAVAAHARLHAIPCVPHASGGAIGTAAALHVLGALPNDTLNDTNELRYLELMDNDNPAQSGLVSHPFRVHDGMIAIPHGPGLGIEVDEDFLRRTARRYVRAQN
jgi:D-galactarolactone cycloisomerase